MGNHSRGEDLFKILGVRGREILDSRGNPTIEVTVSTSAGTSWASIPSGASTGTHEPVELRDTDSSRFRGKGVLKAVQNVNQIVAAKLLGEDCRRQEAIDKILLSLDGTENKSRLGANAVLGVSLAVAKAASNALQMPLFKYLGSESSVLLPVPLMNVINGGKHAGNELKIQEFMIIPQGAENFVEALRWGVEVYHTLREMLSEKYGGLGVSVGDEGGFSPPMKTTEEALEAVSGSVRKAGYELGDDISLGLDAAASNFYLRRDQKYSLDECYFDRLGLLDYYCELAERYPLTLIEDPFEEEDFDGFSSITKKLESNVRIVGDDIFVTNIERIKRGIAVRAANTVLIKPNQIGTLTETIAAAGLAKQNGYGIVASHRSGETEDTWIADIAVALGANMIKAGAPARGERTAKYNRLLKIEEMLGSKAEYAGKVQ